MLICDRCKQPGSVVSVEVIVHHTGDTAHLNASRCKRMDLCSSCESIATDEILNHAVRELLNPPKCK